MDTSVFDRPWNPARRVTRTITMRTTPRRVFELLTTSAGWKQMFGCAATIELRIGGRYEILFDDDQTAGKKGSEGCRVLSFIPDRMLSTTWNAPPEFPHERGMHTWIVFELAQSGEGETQLSFTHLGFGDDGEWPKIEAYFERAWGMVMERIAACA